MVILFSERKSNTEKEIIEILKKHGGDYISDKAVQKGQGLFTIISEYKKIDIRLKKGIAVFCDDTKRFKDQLFPKGIIGICEDSNINALEIFEKSNIPVISCGMNSKNTITLSSLSNESLFTALQRTITNDFGKEVDPEEFKIKLQRNYKPFSIMASVAVLLLKGIEPTEF